MSLPEGLLKSLALLPNKLPIVGLIRHAEREAFLPGSFNNAVNLTQQGKRTCQTLSKILNKQLIKVYTSPVKRCLQTANLLAPAAQDNKIIRHHWLGDPGIFVADRDKAHLHFLHNPITAIVRQLLADANNPPGFCYSTPATVAILINFMLAEAVNPGLYLFITHDSLLSVVLGHLFPQISLEILWPDYLESLFLWQSNQFLCGAYRHLCQTIAY